jgi:hypothetical protein
VVNVVAETVVGAGLDLDLAELLALANSPPTSATDAMPAAIASLFFSSNMLSASSH